MRGSSRRPGRIDRLEPASGSAETSEDREKRQQDPGYSARKRRRDRRKRIMLGCLTAFGIFLLVVALAIAAYIRSINSRIQNPVTLDDATMEMLEQAKPESHKEPFYMLIMGVDARGQHQAKLSDTLIVARIDPENKKATLISIPRDTRVSIPGHGTQKINAANPLGGPSLVIQTVKEFTGLPISYYVEIDFNGFKELVDAMGGVEIDVPKKIVDPKAGNYNPAAYTIYAGRQVLNGDQALTFVRSRNFPDGDFTRMANQQLFARAVVTQLARPENAFKFKSIVDAVVNNVVTNMSVGDLLRLANDMKGMGGDALETVTMPGTPQMIGGGSYVIADKEAFAQILQRVDQGLPADGSGGDGTSAAPAPETVSVTIRNGAGIGGVAADASRRLTRAGFDVGEVGNMNQFLYKETLVVHKDDEVAAQLVQQALAKGKVVPSRGMYEFSTDVLVVVGADWGQPQEPNDNSLPR